MVHEQVASERGADERGADERGADERGADERGADERGVSEHKRNGGDVVVETLEALGVTTVFGIPGQHALGLFDALSRSELHFVSSRVENNSAFAADGYARATGEIGVLFLSTGPGALTALGALQEAYATCVPIVVIASQVPRAGLGGTRKGMLHQLDDQRQSAANVTKSTAVVRQASQIPSVVADAFALAQTAPAGPIWVEVPEDVLLEATHVPPVRDAAALPRSVPPRADLVEAAAKLLARAKRPVILASGGVRRSHGGESALRRLAELLGAPVVSTVGGKGALAFGHPLSAASWIEDRFTTELLENADVLLFVGTSIGEVTSNYFTFAPTGRLIQVDAEVRVLESNHPALAIHADAALALDAIAEHLHLQGAEPARGAGGGAMIAADLRQRVEERLAAQELNRELTLLADIREAVPSDTQTFWDMTIAAYWAW